MKSRQGSNPSLGSLSSSDQSPLLLLKVLRYTTNSRCESSHCDPQRGTHGLWDKNAQGKKDRKQKTFGWWYSNYQLVKRWMDYNKIKILKWNYLSCLVTLNVHAATTHTYPTHAQTYLLCTCTHAQPYKLQCVLTLESGLAEASSLISGREEKERGWYQVSGLDLAPICRLFLTLRNRNSGIARPLYAS